MEFVLHSDRLLELDKQQLIELQMNPHKFEILKRPSTNLFL